MNSEKFRIQEKEIRRQELNAMLVGSAVIIGTMITVLAICMSFIY